ncbi:MAG: sporulation membrane protein YtaF [Lachnospiraceae bacterium]|nr:sporulation membrane protein YtaF [Lachnospiraceae bacterium]
MLSVFLLSVALSIDALGIGISYGLREIRIPLITKAIISIQSVLITAAAIFSGSFITKLLPGFIAEKIGVFVLVSLGVWFIFEGLTEGKEETGKKYLGHTIDIAKAPVKCDADNSRTIEWFEAFYLGLALSLDSFGAGIGAGAAGITNYLIPFMTALCQMFFLCSGKFLGTKIKRLFNVKENGFIIISGLLLIIIGVSQI